MGDRSLVLTEIYFTKAQLLLLTEEERELFLRLGLAVNELMFFQRLVNAVLMSEPSGGAVKDIWVSQLFTAIVTLAGKVHESLLVFERFFLSSTLGRNYRPQMPQQANEAIELLRESIGRDSLLADIRNNFSFHFHSEEPLSPHLDAVAADSRLSMYGGLCDANTVHHYALEPFVTSFNATVERATTQEALKKVVSTIGSIVSAFNRFVIAYGDLMFEKMGACGKRIHPLESRQVGKMRDDRFVTLISP